jgi:putative copper resistance protein D
MNLRSSSLSKLPVLLVLAWLGVVLLGSAVAALSSEAPEAAHSHHQSAVRPIEKIEYSEFNHHTAGAGVLFIGFLALGMEAGITRRPDFHALLWLWPFGWFLLGGFLFIRNDPDNWPWGPIGLLDSWRDPEALQHQIFVVVVMTIGVIEGLRVGHRLNGQWWKFFFPALGIGAGLLLGLHAQVHALTPHVFLEHTVMAVLAILLGVSKLLRERGVLAGRYGSLVWPTCMILLAMQLLFYTEHY